MSMNVNIGGVWKTITDPQCNIGGVWHKINSGFCNINGVWKQLYTRMKQLFTAGAQNVSWSVNNFSNKGAYIEGYATGYHDAELGDWYDYLDFYTTSKIDLTNYTKIKVDWAATSVGGNAGVSISSSVPPRDNLKVYRSASFGRITDTIDITSYTGTWYIGITGRTGSGTSGSELIDVYNVWLE